MAKQKLEQYVKNSLNNDPDVWFTKLFNNHFTATPGDFIITTPSGTILLECKQIQYINHNTSFPFARLTQENEMLRFENAVELNQAFILLMFWTGRLKTSYVYLLPLGVYLHHKDTSFNKSINVQYLEDNLSEYKIQIKNGLLDLTRLCDDTLQISDYINNI